MAFTWVFGRGKQGNRACDPQKRPYRPFVAPDRREEVDRWIARRFWRQAGPFLGLWLAFMLLVAWMVVKHWGDFPWRYCPAGAACCPIGVNCAP